MEFRSFTAYASPMTRGAKAPLVSAALKQDRGGYVFRLRINEKPANARSSVSAAAVPTIKIDAADETVLLPPLVCNAPTGMVLR